MDLKKIVPEYRSKNFLVRKLFFRRLETAFDLFCSKLNREENLRLVDLGCGEGVFLKMIEKKFKGIETFGLDINPNINELRKTLRAGIRVADIRKTGYPDDFFDFVFCLDVLEHFENLEEPIREIVRITKPNGFLVVSLPTENLFYKVGRFLIKGIFSSTRGPSSSPHFYGAKEVEKFLIFKKFRIIKKKRLPKFFPLFYLILFRNVK